MKTQIICIIAMVISFVTIAQEKPIKVVFDVTSKNVAVHESTVRHISFVSEAYKTSEFQVVIYSGALNMLLKDKSSKADEIANLIKKNNVTFVVCQGTMKRYKAKKSDLIDGVIMVPDGILELVEKQAEGWGYIKEAQ